MEKKISTINSLEFKQNMPGFNSIDMYHTDYNIEPFLVFTEFHMDRPIFGPHPHAGVSVMTYMLPDSKGAFLNRDSKGDHSVIEPGGIHVTQAGSGIKHDEVPNEQGVDCHGFQIWINHADKDRLVEPKAFHAFKKDVPEFKTENYLVRVIQGEFNAVQSTIHLVTQTTILDVTLSPNSQIAFSAQAMSFIYLISGNISIQDKTIDSKAMVKFETDGDKIIVTTKNDSANFMFVSGQPHNETIVYGGPFVMTTEQQMHETRLRLGRGEMGELAHL
jgi:quercetin 2,3-dioxygenase